MAQVRQCPKLLSALCVCVDDSSCVELGFMHPGIVVKLDLCGTQHTLWFNTQCMQEHCRHRWLRGAC